MKLAKDPAYAEPRQAVSGHGLGRRRSCRTTLNPSGNGWLWASCYNRWSIYEHIVLDSSQTRIIHTLSYVGAGLASSMILIRQYW